MDATQGRSFSACDLGDSPFFTDLPAVIPRIADVMLCGWLEPRWYRL